MAKNVLQMKYHAAKKEISFRRFQDDEEIAIRNGGALSKYINMKGKFVLQNFGNIFFKDIAAIERNIDELRKTINEAIEGEYQSRTISKDKAIPEDIRKKLKIDSKTLNETLLGGTEFYLDNCSRTRPKRFMTILIRIMVPLRSQRNCVKQGKTFLKELSANT